MSQPLSLSLSQSASAFWVVTRFVSPRLNPPHHHSCPSPPKTNTHPQPTQVLGHTAKSSIARPRELLAISSAVRGQSVRPYRLSHKSLMNVYDFLGRARSVRPTHFHINHS